MLSGDRLVPRWNGDILSTDEASSAVGELIAAVSKEEIKMRGRANFWSRVAQRRRGCSIVCLKRGWIGEATFVAKPSGSGQFHQMISGGQSVSELAANSNRKNEPSFPASMALLGMGSDGYTANWFPGASNLGGALNSSKETGVCIDAEGGGLAGKLTGRLTLTRRSVSQSHRAILMIFGDEKRETFLRAMSRPIERAPIRAAVEDLDGRLIIVRAPWPNCIQLFNPF